MMQCAAKKTLSISRMKVGGMYRSPFFSSQVVTKRYIHKVSLQLDYYMSPQFAGIAVALSNSLYQEAGMELNFLPICPVGLEMNAVRNHANNAASSKDVAAVSIGSVEQNIFVPTLQQYPGLGLNAVAAMFRRSPLCLASMANTDSSKRKNPTERLTVGVHEDSVSVIQKVLAADTNNSYSVLASPRSTKNTDLLQGKFDSVQAYLTTEVPTLERQVLSSKLMGTTVVAKPLEGMNGAKLGYSQVLFCPKEDLSEGGGKREVINSFLDVTFRGWEEAIRDPESAARSVDQCRAMLRLDEENNDHWHNSFDYTVQSVGLCGNFVKETFQGDRLGVIDAQRWNDATNWLLEDDNIPTNFGLDETEIWKPSSQLLAGNELARNTLEKAANSARAFCGTHDRKPSLAVVTVGELPRYTHGERRLQLYSNNDNSWFNKTSVGLANGFEVQEILLPPTTTTDELLSQLYTLDNDATVDGIQLMWPLPPQIDAAKAYNSISLDRDVDGAHYIGQLELGSPSTDNMSPFPLPPVTPMSIITLMDHHDVSISNRSILVVGRSRIVGSPLAHMLRERGAIVTVAHSQISSDKLESLVKSADIVVSCAGSPKLIKSEWIQAGTDVINCGTTFDYHSDTLCSDFDGDLASVANKYSPVPGGVGPLSVAFLLKNVVNAAQERVANDDK